MGLRCTLPLKAAFGLLALASLWLAVKVNVHTVSGPMLMWWHDSSAALLLRWRDPGAANQTSVLVCVCSSYRGNGGQGTRIAFLKRILAGLLAYRVPVHIIVDTDAPDLHSNLPRTWLVSKLVRVVVHESLANTLHLAWKHREHFLAHLHQYSAFMYVEDDMEVPFATYTRYLENFKLLWPARVPCLVRIETGSDGVDYCSDYRDPFNVAGETFVVGNRTFASRPWGYSACWIMPGYALRTTVDASFTEVPPKSEPLPREIAASYTWWGGQLGKPLGLEVAEPANATVKYMVDRRSLVFHFSNSFLLGGHKLVPLPKLLG